jgi:acyl carrier protein phosphodiesterase
MPTEEHPPCTPEIATPLSDDRLARPIDAGGRRLDDPCMNLLAHALLAGADDDVRFGSLVGDFVRGAIDPALRVGVRAGIALHRSVDAYTDTHPRVVAARARFAPPFRRYAGILLDVWFDHLLARDWSRWAPVPLATYSREVRALLERRADEVPPRMRRFVEYLGRNDLPERYRERAMIADVFRGLSQRLSRDNPLAHAMPAIEAQADALEGDFAAFFPDLLAHAGRERARLGVP